MTENFDYSFSENGLVAYHKGKLIGETVSEVLLLYLVVRIMRLG